MSKISLQERNKKRAKLINKFLKKRLDLKAKANDKTLSDEERFEYRLKLAKLPLNSSPTRYKIRCRKTGRGRGNFRKFELCRNEFRKDALNGLIPGVTKASW
ncbi:30S ribosomal protein S14 [Rickettsiales bacterium LUAb2]